MNALQQYLKNFVEPTFSDFQSNPHSARHAFIACVVAYHSIDRVTYPKGPGNLRKDWRVRSLEFTIVDMVAHKLKHVVSDDERQCTPPGKIPLSMSVFGTGAINQRSINSSPIDAGSLDLYNLHFVIRDAIAFLRQEALRLPGASQDK